MRLGTPEVFASLLLLAAIVRADDVELTHGKVFEDVDIRIDEGTAIIELGFGSLRIPASQIAQVTQTDVGAADWRPKSERPSRRSASPPTSSTANAAPPDPEPWRRLTQILVEALERRDDQIDKTLEIIETQVEEANLPAVVVTPYAPTLLAVGTGFFDGSAADDSADRNPAARLAPLPIFGISPSAPALGSGTATWSQLARRQPGSLIPPDR